MRARRQRGTALLLALVVLVLVDTSLALLAGALQLRMREEQRAERDLRLLALADAAVARTLACLATRPGCGGVPEEELDGGTYAAEVTATAGPRQVIVARAVWGAARLDVEAEVELTAAGPVVVRWRRLPAAH